MIIELTQGYQAIVDDEDYDKISHLTWRVNIIRRHNCRPQITAIASLPRQKGVKRKTVSMHRVLMEALHGDITGKIIDHIDHNKLNNSKSNLRFATRQQNSANMRKKNGNSSSQYKGVCYVGYKNKPWRMTIKVNGKAQTKCFATELEAAKEYNKRAVKAFGEFAYLNSF